MADDETAVFDHWRDVATEEDLQAFQKAGFGVRCGFGESSKSDSANRWNSTTTAIS